MKELRSQSSIDFSIHIFFYQRKIIIFSFIGLEFPLQKNSFMTGTIAKKSTGHNTLNDRKVTRDLAKCDSRSKS